MAKSNNYEYLIFPPILKMAKISTHKQYCSLKVHTYMMYMYMYIPEFFQYHFRLGHFECTAMLSPHSPSVSPSQ